MQPAFSFLNNKVLMLTYNQPLLLRGPPVPEFNPVMPTIQVKNTPMGYAFVESFPKSPGVHRTGPPTLLSKSYPVYSISNTAVGPQFSVHRSYDMARVCYLSFSFRRELLPLAPHLRLALSPPGTHRPSRTLRACSSRLLPRSPTLDRLSSPAPLHPELRPLSPSLSRLLSPRAVPPRPSLFPPSGRARLLCNLLTCTSPL